MHLCNAFTLALASRSPEYARLLNAGYLNLPDGSPLVFIAKRLGLANIGQGGRARGTDVFCRTVDRGRATGLRHFLYGSTDTTVAAVAQRLVEAYPGALIVGAYAPPFRPFTPEEEADAIALVRAASPHIVWVALGTPQQDQFIARVVGALGMTLVGVGAAFDFISGTKPQAPPWMQRVGLEWLFRLASEPRRLWKRYLFGNVQFLVGAARGTRVLHDDGPAAGSDLPE